MVIASDIETFIECLENYFSKRSDKQVVVETPYLTDSISNVISDFTGVISISGNYSGHVYFTAPGSFLEKLIQAHGQQDFSENLKKDVVGEITNTLSGNSRRELGKGFVISVPTVIHGDVQELTLERGAHSYVVPMTWLEQKAAMVVSVIKI